MSSLQNMNIDIINGVAVVEDVNLRRGRVHHKGGRGGEHVSLLQESFVLIKSPVAASSLSSTYMAASTRLLTSTMVSSLLSMSATDFSLHSVSVADFFLHSMSVVDLLQLSLSMVASWKALTLACLTIVDLVDRST